MGGGGVQRQHGDVISFVLFFKIRKIGRNEEFFLLGYNEVYFVESLPTFQRKRPASRALCTTCFMLFSCLAYTMDALCSSEPTVVFHRTTRRYDIPDVRILHNHRRENSNPTHNKPPLVSRRQYNHCFERKHLDFCIQNV
jgi:hypothetical protein